MEEVATCECGKQRWLIYRDRLECCHCKKIYVFNDAKASHLTFLVNNEEGGG